VVDSNDNYKVNKRRRRGKRPKRPKRREKTKDILCLLFCFVLFCFVFKRFEINNIPDNIPSVQDVFLHGFLHR